MTGNAIVTDATFDHWMIVLAVDTFVADEGDYDDITDGLPQNQQ